jgi:hypothetical protein
MQNFFQKLNRWNIFELGNSLLLYYLVIYGAFPLARLLHVSPRISSYLAASGAASLYPRAIFLIMLGTASLLVGYWATHFALKRLSPGALFADNPVSAKRAYGVFVVLLLVGLMTKGARILGGGYFHVAKSAAFTSSPFYSLFGLLDWIGPAALAFIFAYSYGLRKSDAPSSVAASLSWTAFAIELVYGAVSGSRVWAAVPILVWLIVRHFAYRPSALRVLVAVLFIFFFLMPVVKLFSNYQGIVPYHFVGESGSTEFTTDTVTRFAVDSFFRRTDQSVVVSRVFDSPPGLLHGTSFKDFFVALGPPRFIWRSKPVTNPDGNALGRSIGLLPPTDTVTSVGPTSIGDLYLNFGLGGVLLGMMIGGALLKILYYFLITRGNCLSSLMIYSVVWLEVIKGSEDWIAPVAAGIVKLFIIFFIVHLVLVGKRLPFVRQSVE